MEKTHKPCGPYERFFKRPIDFLCALSAIIVFSWLYIIVAILVKVKLGSPIIFTQQRPGKNEKIFKLYKFRTMTDEKDEEEPHFIRRNSDRRNWRWVMGVAATFLLLFGIGWGVMEMKKKPIPPTPQDTFTDPQDAYRVLQATLVDVSRNWQAGLKQMQEAQVQMCIINKEVKQELSK